MEKERPLRRPGAEMRDARRAAGMTQQELAEHLGISQGTLADIERGRTPLAEDHYPKLPPAIRKAVIREALLEAAEHASARRARLRSYLLVPPAPLRARGPYRQRGVENPISGASSRRAVAAARGATAADSPRRRSGSH